MVQCVLSEEAMVKAQRRSTACDHAPEWMASHHGGPLNVYACTECCATLPFPPSHDEPRQGPGLREARHAMRVEMTVAWQLAGIHCLWEPGVIRNGMIEASILNALELMR
jgi:hypothetical protein